LNNNNIKNIFISRWTLDSYRRISSHRSGSYQQESGVVHRECNESPRLPLNREFGADSSTHSLWVVADAKTKVRGTVIIFIIHLHSDWVIPRAANAELSETVLSLFSYGSNSPAP
jgi:hypothetical protein